MHAEFLESPVIFSRRSSVEGTSKCRKRKRPRVPASKHARALRGRAPWPHACVRAYVRACVRACVSTVNDRRARTPQGHALTHVRAPLRARSRARARVSTLSRAITAPSTFDFLRFSFFFFLFFSFLSSSSLLIFLQTLPSTVLLLYHDELCTRGYYSRRFLRRKD